MKKNQRWIILVIVAAIIVFWILGTMRNNAMVQVKTVKAQKGTIISRIFTTGVIKAKEQVKISSKSGGRLAFLGVKEGDIVKKGELIAKLDDAELIAQSKQAEASLDQAKIDLETSKKNHERMSSLFAEKVITEQQMDNALSQLKVSQARLKQIQGQADLIQTQLDNARITTPISGMVFQKFINPGEIINPGAPLVTVFNPSSLYVEVNIDEADVGKIRNGQPAEIRLDAYPGAVVEGNVNYIASASQDIKEKGVTFLVEILIKKNGVQLRLGMTADVDITIGKQDNILKIPGIAILEKEGKKYVFIAENGKAVRKEITTGLESDEESGIASGIKEGDEVITTNVDKLADKKPVRVPPSSKNGNN